MSLLPVLLNWPLVLMPVHIALLELIIDPACSVVFEAEPGGDVAPGATPPRRVSAPLFGTRLLAVSLAPARSACLAVLALPGPWAAATPRPGAGP